MKSSLVVSSRRIRPSTYFWFRLLRPSSSMSSLSSSPSPSSTSSLLPSHSRSLLILLLSFFHGDRAKIISFQSAELIRFLRDLLGCFADLPRLRRKSIILHRRCFISSTVQLWQRNIKPEIRPRFYLKERLLKLFLTILSRVDHLSKEDDVIDPRNLFL